LTFYRCYGKRFLDLALTIPAVTILSPLLGLIALLVRLKLGLPILFRQQRLGLHRKPFTGSALRPMLATAMILS